MVTFRHTTGQNSVFFQGWFFLKKVLNYFLLLSKELPYWFFNTVVHSFFLWVLSRRGGELHFVEKSTGTSIVLLSVWVRHSKSKSLSVVVSTRLIGFSGVVLLDISSIFFNFGRTVWAWFVNWYFDHSSASQFHFQE